MSRTARVLFADDEPNIRFLCEMVLTSETCQVFTAENGEAALLWLNSSRFDLAVLDLRMPGIGGLDVLESLRMTGDETPVVVITAYGSVPDAVEAMKLGAVDFLQKPLSPAKLRNVVHGVLNRDADSPAVTPESEFKNQVARARHALRQSNLAEAEVFLKQALALRDESAQARNLYGVLKELQGATGAAYREYRAALKADRHYEPAQRNMQRYFERSRLGISDIPVDLGIG